MSPEHFVSRAKALPAKRSEKGYGDENEPTTDMCLVGITVIIGTFRSEYKYDIKYGYDFPNLVLLLSLITFHTNFVTVISFSTGQ